MNQPETTTKPRMHFIPLSMAETLEDAHLIAPSWTKQVNPVDGGWMCLDHVPPPCVWDGIS